MRNGLVPLWILVLVILALFFAPIPFRYETVNCAQPLVYSDQYKPCPSQLTIGWSPSIAQSLYKRIQVLNLEPPETDDITEIACGGNAAPLPGVDTDCPTGYTCQVDPDGPLDAPGKCIKIEGKFCGGIAANLPENQCPKGYKCQLEGDYPDAGGKCVKT